MNWIQRFLYGRNGLDALNHFLMAVFLVLYLLSSLLRSRLLEWTAIVVMVWMMYRFLSRRLDKRRLENARFLEMARPIIDRIRTYRCRKNDRDHTYFKCPNCGQQLRAPKGLGKISITCRACGASFEEKT